MQIIVDIQDSETLADTRESAAFFLEKVAESLRELPTEKASTVQIYQRIRGQKVSVWASR